MNLGWSLRRAALAAALLLGTSVYAQAQNALGRADAFETRSVLGNYLAARQAERTRDAANAARFAREALRTDPNSSELLAIASRALVEDGQFDAGAEFARRVSSAGPTPPLTALTLAVAATKARNYADAATMLASLPNTGINRVVGPMLRAWALAGGGEGDRALEVLRQAGEINGFRAAAAYHAALINDMLGRDADAEAAYRRSIENEGAVIARLVEAAGAFFERQGQAAVAREIYGDLLKRLPDNQGVIAALGRAGVGPAPAKLVTDAGRGMAEALFDITAVLRQEANNGVAHFYGRLALALAPDVPAITIMVADTLEALGMRAQAVALYDRLPSTMPQNYAVQIRVAENLSQMGQFDEAARRLRALAEVETGRPDALIALAQMLRSRESYPEAIEVYDRALARIARPEPRHWPLYYARAISYERSKQWPKAEADFLKALELQPEQPDVMNYLAYTWVEQGVNFERSRTMLERAVQLRPNSGHIVDSLGWVLYKIGMYKDAVPVLERAVELLPEDPVLLDHLGDALWRVGRTNEARFQWLRSLRNNPEPELKVQLEQKLETGLGAPKPI